MAHSRSLSELRRHQRSDDPVLATGAGLTESAPHPHPPADPETPKAGGSLKDAKENLQAIKDFGADVKTGGAIDAVTSRLKKKFGGGP